MSKKSKSFYETEVERIYDDALLRPEQYQYIRLSRAFMLKNYSERLELNELAKSAFMSRYHYVRIFQMVYGLTPRAYLRDLRISKAKEQLIKGGSITQVCFDVGYESVSTFSSVFKKCVGCTPKQFARDNA